MKYLKALLSEKGKPSSVRVMAMASLVFSFLIAIWGLSTGKDPDGLAVLCAVFVSTGLGAKTVSKFAECREETIKKDEEC